MRRCRDSTAKNGGKQTQTDREYGAVHPQDKNIITTLKGLPWRISEDIGAIIWFYKSFIRLVSAYAVTLNLTELFGQH